jgi:hypothetical protein
MDKLTLDAHDVEASGGDAKHVQHLHGLAEAAYTMAKRLAS